MIGKGSYDAHSLFKGVFNLEQDAEDLANWLSSPEGELSYDVREKLWNRLAKADVDAENRIIIWPEGERLSLEQSVKRFHEECSQFPQKMIERHLIGWLEMGFEPEHFSEEQMDKFEDLVEQ